MRRPFLALVTIALAGPAFAGCLQGDDGTPPPIDANACTRYPEPPSPSTGSTTFSGDNAFNHVLRLVCDFEGAHPKPLYRVPGTPEHVAMATHLVTALQTSGFAAAKEEFTGSEFEAIMRSDTTRGTSYRGYLTDCDNADGDDLERMRGLRFYNVVATGGTPGGPRIYLMAHWDSKRYVNTQDEPVLGANDGASGVGVLIELARVLDAGTFPWEFKVLLTDGEDGFEDCHPLAGSTVHAERLTATQRAQVQDLILLDMVGDPNATFHKGCGSDAALATRIWAVAQRLQVAQFKNASGCGVIDDHVPFEERGMPGVDVIDYRPGFPPYWHTKGDTPDKLTPKMLGDVGRVLHEVIKELPLPTAI